ncbi:type VI secretion system lipoprotein TssJ [Pseudomonas sp. NPDC087626]|uniref:type VI secretion system lipoprotein TssJ n=1 Tax=Pseudomonas sp. NPDC087626 TaxID=3364444 RepID=UPI00380F8650
MATTACSRGTGQIGRCVIARTGVRSRISSAMTCSRLDFTARASINTAAAEMNALATSTLVRVYQLRSRDALDRTTYAALVDEGAGALQADRLHEQALVVKPGEGAQLSVALDKDAQFVAVVALFREPDTQAATWRLVLGRDDLDPDRARVIELADNRLSLRPLAKD